MIYELLIGAAIGLASGLVGGWLMFVPPKKRKATK